MRCLSWLHGSLCSTLSISDLLSKMNRSLWSPKFLIWKLLRVLQIGVKVLATASILRALVVRNLATSAYSSSCLFWLVSCHLPLYLWVKDYSILVWYHSLRLPMVKLENTHTISQSQKENPTSPSNTLGITGNYNCLPWKVLQFYTRTTKQRESPSFLREREARSL